MLEDKGGGDFQVSNTAGQFIRALAPYLTSSGGKKTKVMSAL